MPSAALAPLSPASASFIAAMRRGAGLDVPAPPPASVPPPAPGLQIDPTQVLPGGVVVLRMLDVPPDMEVRGRLAGYPVRFRKGPSPDARWSLVGLDPWVKAGTQVLELESQDGAGNRGRASVPVVIGPVSFPEERVALPASAGGPLSADAQAEFAQVEDLVRRYSPEKLWDGLFQVPVRDGSTSSVFGARRSYGGGPVNSQHTGWDLAVPSGTPIVAPNHGRVVLVGLLPSRGNTVILDHGLGVFSLYLHLSRILVREGDMVAKGQPIGLVGATGLATGPHLHWEVRVGGATVDPALWLQHAYGE